MRVLVVDREEGTRAIARGVLQSVFPEASLPKAQRFVTALRALGCEFALDDLGVGFSFFHQLKHLSVDYLKIDGSFVLDLPTDPADQHLVQAIVQIARGLGKRTVAEYVENEETLELLRTLGVDYAQGYWIGYPAPVETALAGLR